MIPVIQIDSLRKTYSKAWRRQLKEALCGVSLSVGEGETFGFIGPNGAGKSTLIKILIGVLKPTSGQARLFGHDASEPAARRGLGFVPENPSLQDFLTPYEILLMGLRLHGARFTDERQHCMRWLERFDLAAVAHSPLRGFSKGMIQRTALAHAMAIEPRLLVLDEPLSGLDPVGRKSVVDILADYRRQGGTLFLTSHVLHDVERLADRFGLIHKGVLRAVSSPSELVSGDDLVLVRSLGRQSVVGMTEEVPGRWLVEAPRSQLWSAISRLQAAGHELVEVKPSLSLEAAFLRIVAQGQ